MDPQTTTPTQEELLNATTPEALADLMAKAGGDQGVTDTEGAPTATTDPAPAPATEGATPGASDEQRPSGIATKSGQGVLPYRVLQEERDRVTHHRTRAEQAERERDEAMQRLSELRSKTVPDELLTTARDMTESEIADLDYLNPKAAKAVRLARGLATAEAPAAPASAPAPAQPEPSTAELEARDEALAALSNRRLLTSLAESGGPLWNQAQDLDAALKVDAAWAAKPLADRFKEVERRIAAQLGVQLADDAPPPPPNPAAAAPKPAPAAPAPAIPAFRPNTSSDLVGGATPTAADGISEQADPMALVNRFHTMTDSQIQAVVRRAAGG